jgi:uncharacterized cupredoxin-like copper-binding protein
LVRILGRRLAWAGIALLAILAVPALTGLASNGESGVATVRVIVHHSGFEPTEIRVERGSTVRFVIENRDPIDHEFILGDETVQRVHENGTEAHHGAKPGEVSVPAGETRVTTYTFDEPGTLLFGCHLPGHYAYGMRGVVLIA